VDQAATKRAKEDDDISALIQKGSSKNPPEVLQKVVLNRGAGQEHTPLGFQGVQRLIRLVLAVLQTMALQRNHK
jgi:hypothetical protein